METLDVNAVPDLILLDTITEENVYKNVVNRYYKDEIYVMSFCLRTHFVVDLHW